MESLTDLECKEQVCRGRRCKDGGCSQVWLEEWVSTCEVGEWYHRGLRLSEVTAQDRARSKEPEQAGKSRLLE